jgi:hypothetical protein
MVIDVKPLHLENAEFPIEVTLDGMVTDVKPLERSNIYSLVVATLVVKEFSIKNKKRQHSRGGGHISLSVVKVVLLSEKQQKLLTKKEKAGTVKAKTT